MAGTDGTNQQEMETFIKKKFADVASGQDPTDFISVAIGKEIDAVNDGLKTEPSKCLRGYMMTYKCCFIWLLGFVIFLIFIFAMFRDVQASSMVISFVQSLMSRENNSTLSNFNYVSRK